jgi:hypothetical protein
MLTSRLYHISTQPPQEPEYDHALTLLCSVREHKAGSDE